MLCYTALYVIFSLSLPPNTPLAMLHCTLYYYQQQQQYITLYTNPAHDAM